MKLRIIICLVLTLIQTPIYAAQHTTQNKNTDLSYSLGFDIGAKIHQGFASQQINIDSTAFATGIQDAMAGKKPKMGQAKLQKTLIDFQQKMVAAAEKKAKMSVLQHRQALVNGANSPVVGDKNGPVSFIEFFDYQCIHCRRMAPAITQILKQDPKIRMVYKEFPIFGEQSQFAALAALASAKQDKYLQFHNALMASKKPLNNGQVLAIAKQVGLNTEKLQKDMQAGNYRQELKANFKLANDLGIQGTPAFIIIATKQPKNKPDDLAFFIPGAAPVKYLEEKIQQVQAKATGKAYKFPATKAGEAKPAADTWKGV